MVAGYHGYKTDLIALRRRYGLSLKGATLKQMIQIAEDIRDHLGLWNNSQRASAEVKALAFARAEEFGRRADALQAPRATLPELAERWHGDDRPDCPIIERMAGEFDGADSAHHAR